MDTADLLIIFMVFCVCLSVYVFYIVDKAQLEQEERELEDIRQRWIKLQLRKKDDER